MKRIIFLIAVAAVALQITATARRQAPPVTVRIVSPSEGAYVSGPMLLRALVDPPTATNRIVEVTFFADGRIVCRIKRPPFECEWDAGAGVEEHVVRVSATLGSGERIVRSVRTKGLDLAERVDVDVVLVTAVVTDGDGRFVRNLDRGAFRIYEDDKPQQITYFATENIPLELVTAVDMSASMRDAMAGVKQAARTFLGALPESGQVTLVAFNENIFTLVRRSTDKGARMKAVERLEAWGGTALYDVILRSIDLLGRQPGRRSLVVFSDGEDQSSHASVDTVLRRVEASDATIYMIGQGRATSTPDLQKLMGKLTSISGGRSFFTDEANRLEKAFGEIVDDLSNQYLLGYPPTNDRRDGTWRKIRVEVAGGHRVRARLGYRAVRHD